LDPFGKIADLLLSKVAPKAEALAADHYREYSCNPPPWAVHCPEDGDLFYRDCGDSWCGSWHFIGCC